MITNIGEYPKGLLAFFINNNLYLKYGREEVTIHLKKPNNLKEEQTKQYRQGISFPIIYFCYYHCLHLPRLAGVCFGAVRCVCRFFSFLTVARHKSTLLELWKSNPQKNWVYWVCRVTRSGSPLSQSIPSLLVCNLVTQNSTTTLSILSETELLPWIYRKCHHHQKRAEDDKEKSGYWQPQHFQCRNPQR